MLYGNTAMDDLPYAIMTNVLEIINASSELPDYNLVRQKTLDVLFRSLTAEGAIFVLPDQNALSHCVLLKNLDTKYSEDYQNYFHQFDPLQLTHGLYNVNKLNLLEPTCTYSYDSLQPAEYYADFLEPQNIHHKLIINLIAEQEIYGRIVLMRSKKTGRFTADDIHLARTISPFLAHALAHYELRKNVRLKGNILSYIEKQSTAGMILLDDKLQVVYINQKAREIFGIFNASATSDASSYKIPSLLLKDCREIKASLKGCPTGCMVAPKKRMVSGLNHMRFATSSKAFEHEPGWESPLLFMVCIEEVPPPVDINPQFLRDSFHLSKREIEVAELLFAGLKNAQIAEKLFISEITVKKHLQKIYDKVGVNNRTSLINKILTA